MRVYYKISELPVPKPSALAIGIFDGVHLGHQRILNETLKVSKKKGLRSIAVTFYPHPDVVLRPDKNPRLLYSLTYRLISIRRMGFDACLVIPFTRSFSRHSAESFMNWVLFRKLNAKFICVGQHFRFGRDAQGTVRFLRQHSEQNNCRVRAIRAVRKDHRRVSSTLIRRLICTGQLKKAVKFLGKSVSIYGKVVHGRKIGRRLGFRTVNLSVKETLPPPAVYAVETHVKGSRFLGAMHLGPRPTFRDGALSVEAHLLKFHNSMYGKEIEFTILGKIREVRFFSSPQNLKHQIESDIRIIKSRFSNPSGR